MSEPTPHPDHHKYIVGIKNRNEKIFEELYQFDLPNHIAWVKANGGTAEDGFDNFQDTVEAIVRKVFFSPFSLSYGFRLYLHGVSHKLWYKKLKKKKNEKLLLEELVRKYGQKEYLDKTAFEKLLEETIDGNKWAILKERTFQKISSLCQKLLRMDMEGKKAEDIAATLEMETNAVYRRKHACKLSWRKAMEADPDFKNYNPFNL